MSGRAAPAPPLLSRLALDFVPADQRMAVISRWADDLVHQVSVEFGRLASLLDAPADGQSYVRRNGVWISLGEALPFGLAVPTALQFACSDEVTAIAAPAAGVIRLRAALAMTMSAVLISLNGPCATGTFTVDVLVGGTSILLTPLTIDATETTSATAAVPALLAVTALPADGEVAIDITAVGDGTAFGLKAAIIGTLA